MSENVDVVLGIGVQSLFANPTIFCDGKFLLRSNDKTYSNEELQLRFLTVTS